MLEQVLFLIAITFLTLLAFLMVLMYFNIIKFDVKREVEIRKLTKEERKKGWLQLDLNINLFGWKIGNRKKEEESNYYLKKQRNREIRIWMLKFSIGFGATLLIWTVINLIK